MKNSIKLGLTLVLSMTIGLSNAQEKLITFKELPTIARTFVEKQFSKLKISVVSLEKEILQGNSYKVRFTDGTSLEFDKKGNWTEIDSKKNAIPSHLIPSNIVSHVHKSFPNNEVVQISKESNGFEVELTNGLDLKYNRKGDFIKIDD